MTESEFKKQYLGEFKPDQNLVALSDELTNYYKSSLLLSDKDASKRFSKIKEKAKACGISNTTFQNIKHEVLTRMGL